MERADAYRADLAYIHDRGYGGLAADAAARLIDELAVAAPRGGTVVDLGCGSGILAAALSDAGYHVLGIDMSEAMVALARTRAPKAEFRAGSFVSADLPRCVAVTAIGEVLNYAVDPANGDGARADLFRKVYRSLVSGGVFLFDIAGLERAGVHAPQRTHAEGPDWAVLAETTVDPDTRVLTRRITSFRQVGTLFRRDTEVHSLVLMDPGAVQQALRDEGFEVQVIPRYKTVPLPAGAVALVARKARGRS
jgi:SAM-dependent methyltransferase